MPALALTACGGGDDPKAKSSASAKPTTDPDVPAGVTLTKAGTKLAFAKPAVVKYEPNDDHTSVLELTVQKVTQAPITDLAAYVLDDRTKQSTPYYVNVTIKNVGKGDVANTPVPLWAVDQTNTLIQYSTFTNKFAKCPSGPLPTPFAAGATANACLVYLVPNKGTMREVSFRPAAGRGTDRVERADRRAEARTETLTLGPLTLGSLRVETPVVLAPMAGITNAAYRRLCQEQAVAQGGDGLFVCEMITSRGLVEGDETTKKMLVFDEAETVRSVQLYGTDPAYVGKATEILCTEYAVAHVDLNFGCPVPKVTRKGGGAALPWKRKLLAEILEAAVAAGERHGVPVTMKTRKGLDEDHLTFLDAGRIAQESGAAAIALHGRTAIQGYSGTADWDAIGELVESVDIPVLGNGDIWEADDALRMIEHTGAAGVVVGRGCLGRPWLFRDLAAAFDPRWSSAREARAGVSRPGVETTLPALGEVTILMLRHAELLSEHMGEERGCKEFRKHVAWYLKGFPAGGELRHALALVSSLAELATLLDELDPTAPFPVSELGAPRGRQGAPRKRMVLPEGWLDDTDGTGCVVREDANETTGG